MILARCQFYRFPRHDTGKMPVLPTPKAGYWQDASSTDSQGMILARCQFYQDARRILARCQFHRFPRHDTGKMPVLPIPKA
ncbi:hypothetical protein [Moorena sp. SIO3H5]|uniref:hypothetical protein n=1 Tax=Moorena sp. SIO3H5 TaxID=2607834 RepID=UPI0013BE2864|nr:hypothetical protein [Moorena sp. SIO3H5]NEO73059.1 hypothetical protein [Moorena sp. SIO3H5]